MKLFHVLLVSLTLTINAITAQATIVYDGGSPIHQTGYFADTDYYWTETATKNLISSTITFDGMNWWGANQGNNETTSIFTLSIYDGSGDAPGALIASTMFNSFTADYVSHLGGYYDDYAYSGKFNIGAITLAPGTYFFSLSNNDLEPQNAWSWEETSLGLSGGASYTQADGYWQVTGANLAFQLTSSAVASVPEPENFVLFIFGIVMLGIVSLRKKLTLNK
jgi:hypothetical protein